MDADDVVRLRLRGQQLREPFAATAEDALQNLLAVQAQEFPYARWTLAQRTAGGTAPRRQLARAKYSIPAGQSYVAAGPAVATDSYFAIYYDGSAPYDQHDFVGTTKVYEIVYNHRVAFVNAADVDVVPSTS